MTINDTLLIDEVSADVPVLDASNTGHPGVVHSLITTMPNGSEYSAF